MATEFQTRIGNVRFHAMDSMTNVLTGLGGSLDPQANAFYFVNTISQAQIEASYRTSWLSKRVHSAVPKDMVRNWRTFKTDAINITAIEREERRLNVRHHIRRAELLARLYGGSVIVMGVGDDTASELRMDSIPRGGLKYLHTVGRHEVSSMGLILDPGSPWFMQPELYQVNAGGGRLIAVHPSRVIRFIPSDTPDSVLLANGGWGDPMLLSLQSTIINADTLQGTFAAIAAKVKTDTVYIPGLTKIASTVAGEAQLKSRIMVAKAFESLFGVKLMDAGKDGSDSEKWESFQANLTGQPELMMAFLQMVSGASQIPMTRLVGKSADGMNATGAGDEKQYFDYISGEQELELRPRLETLDEALLRSALGSRPDDIWWEWNPLFSETEQQKATVSKLRAETSAIYADSGLIPIDVIQRAVKGELIESGEYPSIEMDYEEYETGQMEPLLNQDEVEEPDERDALVADMVSSGVSMPEALRLTDARPRSLYVSRAVLNVDEIQAWADKAGLGQLQDNLHVTIYTTPDKFDWMKVDGEWNQNERGEVIIAPGGVRIIEPLGDKFTVCLFTSSTLSWRHETIKRDSGTQYTWPDYQPHFSLFKKIVDTGGIKPYQGRIVLGPEEWKEFEL